MTLQHPPANPKDACHAWALRWFAVVCVGIPWMNERVHADDVERAIPGHVDQADIDAGRWSTDDLVEAGRRLFVARFTTADGVGRPSALANSLPRRRPRFDGNPFIRTAGPDANACASCHNGPDVGGAGDFSTNAFVGLGELNPAKFTVERSYSNERGTPDLHGLGIVELLAREITRDLQALRESGLRRAEQTGQPQTVALRSKTISFGFIEIQPDGSTNFDGLEGIDHDLVIRPFGSKGTVVSLRDFTILAANLHHGMQAEERFGVEPTGEVDFDEDGVTNELTAGDITAMTLFQAMLNMPGRVLPADPVERDQVARGEVVFAESRCTDCHIAAMPLDSPVFTQPNEFHVTGTLHPRDVEALLATDLQTTATPAVTATDDGQIIVHVFTDFKRHVIADRDRPHFGNETVVQRRIDTNQFVTRRLWSVGNTSPYGHRGDVTTLAEVIDHHGGEATESRKLFEQQSDEDQIAVIRFLQSMQIVPPGSPPVIIQPPAIVLPYATANANANR